MSIESGSMEVEITIAPAKGQRSGRKAAPKVPDPPRIARITRLMALAIKFQDMIDRGEVRKRDKKPSRRFRDTFGHTPLSVEEQIPWQCRRLVIGTGTGALPVMEQVQLEAQRRKIELVIVPTARAIELLKQQSADTNAVLHVTC